MRHLLAIVIVFSSFLVGCGRGGTTANSATPPSNQEAAATSEVDSERARELSDSIAKAMIEDRTGEVYQNMERVFRDYYSESQFRELTEPMYSAYGKPLEFEMKEVSAGYKSYGGGVPKPMRKIWYAVRTTKHPKGTVFLFTEIVKDGSSLACAGVSMVTFPTGNPPEFN
jgi:hypothetical protein